MTEIELIKKDVALTPDSPMNGLILSMAFNPASKKAAVAIGEGTHLDMINHATREVDFRNHPEKAIARNPLPALAAHEYGFGAMLEGAYNNGELFIKTPEEISASNSEDKINAAAALLVQTLEKHGLPVNKINSNHIRVKLSDLRNAKHADILKLFKIKKQV